MSTPRRRWYQFSLKTLFVTFTLPALILGFAMAFTAKGRQQRAVVERIRGLGGKINYGDFDPALDLPAPNQSYWARQVRKWLGRDHIDHVVGIRVIGEEITDEDLGQIAILAELRALDLYSTSVSDAGLVHIKKLFHLKYLNLSYTAVTDEGMAEIRKALPSCRIENSP
jgi:hypothetical protein